MVRLNPANSTCARTDNKDKLHSEDEEEKQQQQQQRKKIPKEDIQFHLSSG